jgi:hypothetical protein
MADPTETQYEDYFHNGSDDRTGLREEIVRREKAGWSLWSTEPIGVKCA